MTAFALLLSASLMGIIGWFELRVGKSPRGAYLTWGVAGVGSAVFLIQKLLS